MKFSKSFSDHSILANLIPLPQKWISRFLKIAVSLAALVYIVSRLSTEQAHFDQWAEQINSKSLWLMGIVLLLIPINWGLEAARWKRMMRPVYAQLTLFRAFKGVIAGIATGMFTPNRVGEYAGRMWILPKDKRVAAITYTFLNRIYQMQITLISGTLALEYVYRFQFEILIDLIPISIFALQIMRYGLWAINIIAWISILLPHWLNTLFLRFLPTFSWVEKARGAIKHIDIKTLLSVIGLGTIRYLVFSLQYYCLMLAFGYEGAFLLALSMISLIFFIKSIIPFVAVAELGIRESVAITVMGAFMLPAIMAFSSTFILYVCNIIVPALMGLFVINQEGYGEMSDER